MGKIKSSIITALLVIAIVVLAFFATVSLPVPGSNGVKRYNSFAASIHLGGELTGNAYALLYPDGVVSYAYYNAEGSDSKELEGYEAHGGVYVDSEKGGDDLIASVKKDAEIIAERLGGKGYASFSVSVQDDYVIKITLPTDFSYAALRGNASDVRSTCLSALSHTVQYVMLDGELSLRDGTDYDTSNSLLKGTEDLASYIKKVDKYSMGGNHAVRMVLTDDGFDRINAALTSKDSGTAYFYLGETSLGLQLTMGQKLEDKTLMYSAEEGYVTDFTVVLQSVLNNKILENRYNDDGVNSTSLVTLTPSYGEYAAVYLGVLLLLALVASIVYPAVKYKKLGIVNALMMLVYALTLITAILLLNVQVTVAGALTAVFGLALLLFTNIIAFESVKRETQAGRTMQAAVKTGYKKTVATVLDLHIVMLILSLLLTFVGFGEVASCGVILFIATLASYTLYWFTRFMWYVISSPVRDKFAFCGFKRQIYDDDDEVSEKGVSGNEN